MPKTAKTLSARAVSELRWDKTTVDKRGNPLPTSYSVGGAVGLYLQCTKDGGGLPASVITTYFPASLSNTARVFPSTPASFASFLMVSYL